MPVSMFFVKFDATLMFSWCDIERGGLCAAETCCEEEVHDGAVLLFFVFLVLNSESTKGGLC